MIILLSGLPLVEAAKVGPKAFSSPMYPPAEEMLPQTQRPRLLLAILIEVNIAVPVQIAETMVINLKDISGLVITSPLPSYFIVDRILLNVK